MTSNLRKFADYMVGMEHALNEEGSHGHAYIQIIHGEIMEKAEGLGVSVQADTFYWKDQWRVHFRLVTPDMEANHDLPNGRKTVTRPTAG